MEKNIYTPPHLRFLTFACEDVITTSEIFEDMEVVDEVGFKYNWES
ncbi:MAG: hypothetical protein IJX49_02280 [Clostridia bacterium]|nr:hypothetical protein [Clostridia bacterium]